MFPKAKVKDILLYGRQFFQRFSNAFVCPCGFFSLYLCPYTCIALQVPAFY